MPQPELTTFPIGTSRHAKLIAFDANDAPVASAIYSVATTGVAAATIDYTPGELFAVLIISAKSTGTGTVTVTEMGSGVSVVIDTVVTSSVVRIDVEFSDQLQPIHDVRVVPDTDDPNAIMGAGD